MCTTVILVMTGLSAKGQTFRKVFEIPLQGNFLTADHLGNSYVVNHRDEILKISLQGKVLSTFSDKRFGKPYAVDPINPMRLLLLYPDFNTIVLVDNTLSQVATIDLNPIGLINTTVVCYSNDRNFWIYDNQQFRLKKIDPSLNPISMSEQLSAIISPSFDPVFILERNNKVFLSDPNFGIAVFDFFGTFKTLLPIKNVSSFQVIEDRIFYRQDQTLHSYHLQTFEENTYSFPEKPETIKKLFVSKGRLFLLTSNNLILYTFQ